MGLFTKSDKTKAERRELRKQRWYLILSGFLMGIAYPPLPLPFLALIGLVPYLYVLEQREKLAALNRAAYIQGLVFAVVSIYWIGGWTLAADPFLMIGGTIVPFLNAGMYMIAVTLFYFTRRAYGTRTAFFLLPLFWVFVELILYETDLRFPWLALGNIVSLFKTYIQIADIVGVLGITLLIWYTNLFIYRTTLFVFGKEKRYKLSYVGAILLIALPLIYGFYREATFEVSDETVRVGLIQPDIDPYGKWSTTNLNSSVDKYFTLSQKAVDDGAEIIVWPETALPIYLLGGRYERLVDSIRSFVNRHEVYLFTGMPDMQTYETEDEAPPGASQWPGTETWYTSYNGLLMFSPYKEEIDRYGKIILVPFSERTPFIDYLPFLEGMTNWGVGITNWDKGQDTTIFKVAKGPGPDADTLKVGGVVCYEIVFPHLITAFVRQGAEIFVVVTNDSWYGDNSGPYQHKEMSAVRCIENRKSMVRAANGGITCLVDPLGRTIVETDMFETTYLVVDAPIQPGTTFYSEHPSIIPNLSYIITAFIFLSFIVVKIRTKSSIKNKQ